MTEDLSASTMTSKRQTTISQLRFVPQRPTTSAMTPTSTPLLKVARPTIEPTITKPLISVREFVPADQQDVAKLFRDVMGTRFEPSSEFYAPWEEITQERLQSDIGDIQDAYISTGGNFWVAVAPSTDGTAEQIVGIIGLDCKQGKDFVDDRVGEVRSVFVDPRFHRLGIGRKLLTRLVDWACGHGFSRVFLSMMARNKGPRAFYESMGFVFEPQSPPVTIFGGRIEYAKYIKQL